MTVQSSLARQPYTISGTGPYAIPFYFLANADIIAIRTPVGGGDPITLTLTTHYTLSGAGDEDGGALTLDAGAVVNGDTLTIINEPTILQLTQYPETGKFPAASHERALDKLTMIAKRVYDLASRSLRLNDGDTSTSLELPISSPGKLIGWDVNGKLTNTSPAGVGPDSIGATELTAAVEADIADGVAAKVVTNTLGTAAVKNTGTASGNIPVVGAKSATKVLPGLNYDIPQIQPVSASVGSNALTLTLNPTTLDFRSATLTDGTVNTRQVGAAISLVISSGSTLGTVNATAARIAILAIDNAGTVELAAVNLAGGNNLDETTLISTTAEGGIGAADSASTIYSTTARTNVPFRVVGFIDITEATAGTWATAPTTIQGAGGQAISAMASLGYGQTWQSFSVPASRASGTTYYNTTGRPICVSVYPIVAAAFDGIMTIAGVQMARTAMSANTATNQIFGVVPPGASYSVTFTSGSIGVWAELR